MIIFLFAIGGLIIFILFGLAFLTTRIKIDIIYLKIINKKSIDLDFIKDILDECDSKMVLTKKQVLDEIKNMIFSIEYKIRINIYFFNKIRIFSFVIDNNKLFFSKKYNFKFNKKLDLETLFLIFSKLNKIKLCINVSTESPIFTSILTTLINGILTIMIRDLYKKEKIQDIKNCDYKVIQINDLKNKIDISFSCIIELKLVNIINIYKLLNKEGKIKSGKSSNRKSNEKCYG